MPPTNARPTVRTHRELDRWKVRQQQRHAGPQRQHRHRGCGQHAVGRPSRQRQRRRQQEEPGGIARLGELLNSGRKSFRRCVNSRRCAAGRPRRASRRSPPCDATDPHLLEWVHVAEADSFLRPDQLYGAAPLDQEGRDAYVADMAPRPAGERLLKIKRKRSLNCCASIVTLLRSCHSRASGRRPRPTRR